MSRTVLTVILLLGFLLLGFAPAAAADVPMGVPMAALGIHLVGGSQVVGQLLALQAHGADDAVADAKLSGTVLDVEADYVHSTGVGTVSREDDNGTRFHSQKATHLRDMELGSAYLIFVSPLPGAGLAAVDLRADSLHSRPSTEEAATGPLLVDVRPPAVVDVAQAIQVTSDGEVAVKVSGSFRLTLWRVAGTLVDGEEAIEVYSGERWSPVAPVPGTEPVARTGEKRLLFLDVNDGVLELHLPARHLSHAYSASPQSTGSGGLSMDPPGGLSPLVVEGAVTSTVTTGGQGLEVVLQRPLSTVDPPAAPPIPAGSLQPATTTPSASTAPALAWGFAIAASTAIAVVTALLQRGHRKRRFARLQDAFEERRYSEVVSLAPTLRRSRTHRLDAGSMLVVALLDLDRAEEALRVLARMADYPEATVEGLDYLEACVAAHEGDRTEAAALLRPLLAPAARPPQPVPPPGPSKATDSRAAGEGYT